MYGVLTIRNNNIRAKCGYKYLKFNPQMTVLDARKNINYKGRGYSYEDQNKVVIHVDPSDIEYESMTSITLSHCVILNGYLSSGKVFDGKGYKQVVVDRKFNLFPIITRKSIGKIPYRHDVMCYDADDHIIFRIDWDGDKVERSILTSQPYEIDDARMWKKLRDKDAVLFQFLQADGLAPTLPYPQLSQDESNQLHLQRFLKKYRPYIYCNRYDIKVSQFNSMDVIDLSSIDEIRISEPKNLDEYPVFDITGKNLKLKGYGFDKTLFDDLNKPALFEQGRGPQLFMLVTNSCSHRIDVSNRKILTISTVPEESDGSRQLLFIKFNEKVLYRYKRDLLIDRLSI